MSPLPIMVIDDDPGTRETLSDILTEWNYRPVVFSTGDEAVAAYTHQPVGVILTDIVLPDRSGLELLGTVKEINPDVAVVMMSGHASVENAILAINQGASAYIVKPLNMEELRALLKKAFREVRISQENKRLINRLQLTNRDLEVARQKVEETNAHLALITQEMEDLLHVVSHDLKSPLVNIHGFASFLDEQLSVLQKKVREGLPPLDAGARSLVQGWLEECDQLKAKYFPFIKKGVNKMDTMIKSLLRISGIGRRADPFELNNLNQMISDIGDVFSHQFGEKGIEFSSDPLPAVWCRANEINQVFSNLISNAVNYMGEKSPRRISVKCRPSDDHYGFSVEDTGIGIDAKDFDRVFQMFSRLDAVPSSGEGIGLVIVKKIICGHGGKVWIESKKGEGSTFYFTLPKGGEKSEAGSQII